MREDIVDDWKRELFAKTATRMPGKAGNLSASGKWAIVLIVVITALTVVVTTGLR